MLFVPVLLPLPAEAQGSKLPQLFLLRLPRYSVLYTTDLRLSKGPLVQLLQAGLRRPLPAAVQRRLLLRRLPLPVLLPPVLRLRRLPRRPRPVPVVVLQVPVVVLRGGAVLRREGGLLPRLVPRRSGGGAAVPGVLVRLRVLLSPVQRRVPVLPTVR
ncbi:unnamed protein product [Urochloa humidicola]